MKRQSPLSNGDETILNWRFDVFPDFWDIFSKLESKSCEEAIEGLLYLASDSETERIIADRSYIRCILELKEKAIPIFKKREVAERRRHKSTYGK